ncbi:MAG: cytochrome C, partial [Pseudomonadota bacterium]
DAKCSSCHKGDLYKDKLQSTCYSCHQNDDKHKGQEGKKCESCHNENDWKKADFDHAMSSFPLTGKHVQVECKKCHAAVTFKDARSDCWSCHEKQDTHKRRLGKACETCHNTRDWKVWDFDHDKTAFKLTGGHKKVGCYKCHQKPMDKKVAVSSACDYCHTDDDVHDGSFGRQCERCHVVESWKKIRAGTRMLQ